MRPGQCRVYNVTQVLMAFPDDDSPTEDEYFLSYYGGQSYFDLNLP